MEKTNSFHIKKNISPGGHFYQFYKGAEDYYQAVISFLNAGLKRNHACLWLVSKDKGYEETIARANRQIDNFRYYEATEQLRILPAEEWYLENDELNETRIFHQVMQYLEEMQKKGFRCLRITGDATAIPKEKWNNLHAYESKISAILEDLPVIGLCTYPILSCTLQDTRCVIENHTDVLIGFE